MSSQLLYPLSGLALIVDRLLYAVPSPYLDPLHLSMVAIRLVGSYLIVLGLLGPYIRQAGKAGILGLISFVILFVSLIAVTVVEYTYVAPVPSYGSLLWERRRDEFYPAVMALCSCRHAP
jgi:hypothetical protein